MSAHAHGHSHGLVDPSIRRSRAGLRAVALALAVLAATAALQAVVFAASGSVALLADLIHNAGDALTAVPLGAAFLPGSIRASRPAHRASPGWSRGGERSREPWPAPRLRPGAGIYRRA